MNQYLEKIIREKQGVIIDMNTTQLKEHGIDANGAALDEYTPFTISIKQSKGQVTSHTTLYDEGDFQGAFYIQFLSDGFKLWSSDGKTKKLGEKYGYQIFGLTDDNLQEVRLSYILPEILNIIKLKLNA